MSNQVTKNQTVFAVGTGRCGTQFLAKVLKKEPWAASHHELHPLNDTFHRFCKWYDLPIDDAGFIATKRKAIEADWQNHSVSFEASAFLSLSVEALYRHLDAKFILLVRSPEQVINSYIKKGWYAEEIHLEDPDKIPSYQPDEPRFYHFMGRTLPRGAAFTEWQTLSRVGKLAWYWRTLNERVLKQFEQIPASHQQVIRLEDMSYARYQELCEFIGFASEISQEEYQEIADSRPNAKGRSKTLDQWSEQEITEFKQQIGDSAVSLGYSTDIDILRKSALPPIPPLKEEKPSGMKQLLAQFFSR